MTDSTYSTIPLPSLPILVVEDNKDQQLLVGYSLRDRAPRFTATFKNSATEALDYLDSICEDQPRQFPRLVLLDLHLPELWQGWQALSEIRARYPRLPVVVMSSSPRQGLVDKSYDLGAHSFLAKPTCLKEWEHQFASLSEYWLNTVVLSSSC